MRRRSRAAVEPTPRPGAPHTAQWGHEQADLFIGTPCRYNACEKIRDAKTLLRRCSVCTENLIRVDDVTESLKLAE
jgi:hypothetical protein